MQDFGVEWGLEMKGFRLRGAGFRYTQGWQGLNKRIGSRGVRV